MKINFSNNFIARFALLLLAFTIITSCDGSTSGGTNGFVPGGDVVEFQISPDGLLVAYLSDLDTDNVFELFVVDINGGTPLKVSGSLVFGGDVKEFKWAPTPNNSRIAYLADQDTDNIIELYTVKPDGSDSLKISGDLSLGENVMVFEWSPDSTRIAYLADQDFDEIFELYTTPPDVSGFDVRVSTAFAAFPQSGDVKDFAWAPNSLRLAYRANETLTGVIDLYTTLPTSPGSQNVSVLLPGANVEDFAWAPDNSRIAYRADPLSPGFFELFTTTPTSAGSTLISGPLVAGGAVIAFAWAPDSLLISYIADQENDNVFELFTAPPTVAGGSIKVSGVLVAGGNVEEFKWAPNSSRIAYQADQEFDGTIELFTTLPTDQINSPKVSFEPLVPGGNVLEFEWAPDSSLIAYLADQEADEVFEVYASPSDSNIGNVKVSFIDPLVTDGDVVKFVWSPDGSLIAYLADQDTVNVFELYTSLPDGSDNDKVSGALVADGNVEDFEWVSDSSVIVYLADQDIDDIFELYASASDGSSNVKISGSP